MGLGIGPMELLIAGIGAVQHPLAFITGSPIELLIVGIIALLLFGKRLPEVARSLGKGITEFKKGVAGIDDDVNRATYSSASTSAPRPVPREETQEVTAPKFEPPRFTPSEVEEPKV